MEVKSLKYTVHETLDFVPLWWSAGDEVNHFLEQGVGVLVHAQRSVGELFGMEILQILQGFVNTFTENYAIAQFMEWILWP